MQQVPLLQTKLHIPPIRPERVSRPRLLERLNEGLHRKLILLSAPAGYGKTTLASEWVAGLEQFKPGFRAAWLSLDEGDNDPNRFLIYLVAALQTLAAQGEPFDRVGQGALTLLQSPVGAEAAPPAAETILTVLLNEVAAIPDPFVLVLDDYHVVGAQPVDQALNFLLEHLPPQMHLAVASREDPDLPLARYRARDQLTELRAADLTFTSSEAAEFLNRVMGLNLSAGQVASLETRTEGWIAGLQLAALSMQGREDVSGFIGALAGDSRYILDYLVEEVLRRQPEPVRTFLLQTSILDRLCGPLCDTVRFGDGASPSLGVETAGAGQQESRGMLEALERGNLFLIPLDDRRRWYRYHHLFADVLRRRLVEEEPELVPVLHRRASAWYERDRSPADAIQHALAAGDSARAAGLVELAWPGMESSYQPATWLGWVRALPDAMIRDRPVLSAAYAWALLDVGELEAAVDRLRDAERWLDAAAGSSGRGEAPAGQMVVVDDKQFQSLPLSMANARTFLAQALGDAPSTVQRARQALELVPESDPVRRTPALSLLGLACWASGDLEAAHQCFAASLENMRLAGNLADVPGSTFVLADIRLAQGRIRDALRIYEQALQFAASQGEPMPPGMGDLHRGLAELLCERGDLAAAEQHLLTGRDLSELAPLPDWQHRWHVAQARLEQARGDLDAALVSLEGAERLYVRTPLPDVRPIGALKARIWVAQGRLAEAQAWARARRLSADDELSYQREFEHITLVRVLIARYKTDGEKRAMLEAEGLLARLLEAAEAGGRLGSAIELLILQALALEAQGKRRPALAALERALMLAEPEGYVRVFAGECPPMAALLREAASRPLAPGYARRLRAACGQDPGRSAASQSLIEPLTGRELDVLRLLGTDLSGPEIAGELVVSLNTLRSHTKNIYGKLGVNSRRAAVRRAEELGLE